MSCGHPDPFLCAYLKQHIHGRLWEIWNGQNISPEEAAKYRELWINQAKAEPATDSPTEEEKQCDEALKPCEYRIPIMENGRQKLKACG